MCDIGRAPYRVQTRFFRDSSLEVTQRWYVAAPGAATLPFPSAFLSSKWDDNDLERDYYARDNLGEVAGTRTRADFRGMPTGHLGGHQCGEREWWTKGVPVDPARPPVQYRPDGIPTCCAPGRGILWGSPKPKPSGGLFWASGPNYPSAYMLHYVGVPPQPDLFRTVVRVPGSDPPIWRFEIVPGVPSTELRTPAGPPPFPSWYVIEVLANFGVSLSGSWDGWGTRDFDIPFGGPAYNLVVVSSL